MTRLSAWWAALTETRHTLRAVPPLSRSRSLVAGANALFRAAEAERPAETRILNDPYAARFVERHPLVQAIKLGRFVAPPLRRELARLQTAHCTRHRALDALVEEALVEGFGQIVIVGAGYDTRALRLGQARWFEVDAPGTAAQKRARLGTDSPAIATPCDLIAEGLGPALAATDFDPAAPACFVLEGLIHYLPPVALDQLVADMAAGSGRRRVLLSFIDPRMVPEASVVFTSLVKVVREAPRQYFEPEALAARFPGFAMTGRWPFEAQVEAFAPAAAGRLVGVSQDVARFDR